MSGPWSIAQAALIVEKPLEVFQKIVERAPVKPRLLQRGGRKVRAFELRDLVFFSALDDLKQSVTPKIQIEIYGALVRALEPVASRNVEIGRLTYDFDPYLRGVRAKIKATEKLFDLIDASGTEPMIKGTRIEVYRIAALCSGMAVEEILRDYPSLTDEQVSAARVYADAHPKAGRPYPKVTGKKALRDARAKDAEKFLSDRM